MAQVAVGLDLGTETVRAARLKVGFKTMELEQLLVRRVDGDAASAVAEVTKGADLVFSSLSGDEVSIRKLRLPAAAAKRIESILPFELDGEIPFEVHEMIIDHAVLSSRQDGIEVMAVAARRTAVEAHLATLARAGLNPREVGAGALSMLELAQLVAPTGTVALVEVGHARTDVLVSSGGVPARARTCSVGGRDVTRALARAFGVPDAVAAEWKQAEQYLGEWDPATLAPDQSSAVEAVTGAADRLAREIRQTLASHVGEGGAEVERLVLCGGGSALPGLREHLAAALGLRVDPLELPAGIVGGDGHEVTSGARAISLALRGAALRKRRIDLRRGDLAFAGEARSGRGLFLHALAAVLAIMLAWGFSAYARGVSLRGQRDAQYAELESASKRLLGEPVDTFASLEALLDSASRGKASDSPLPTGDAFDVVEQISKRVPAEINHEIDSLDIRTGRIQIQGRVDQRRDADAIEAALSSWEECFTKVQVTRTTPAVRDKRLQYTMDIESRCP